MAVATLPPSSAAPNSGISSTKTGPWPSTRPPSTRHRESLLLEVEGGHGLVIEYISYRSYLVIEYIKEFYFLVEDFFF